MIQNSSVRNRPRPSAASSEANASAAERATIELRGELGDLGAAARGERREHERARIDLRREVLGNGALVEVGEDAGLVERGVRGDHALAIAIEAERERGRDGDAIEDLVGVLDPRLGVEPEVGRLVRERRRVDLAPPRGDPACASRRGPRRRSRREPRQRHGAIATARRTGRPRRSGGAAARAAASRPARRRRPESRFRRRPRPRSGRGGEASSSESVGMTGSGSGLSSARNSSTSTVGGERGVALHARARRRPRCRACGGGRCRSRFGASSRAPGATARCRGTRPSRGACRSRPCRTRAGRRDRGSSCRGAG